MVSKIRRAFARGQAGRWAGWAAGLSFEIASWGWNLFHVGMKSNVNPSGSLRRGASAILLLLCFLVTAVVVFHALWAPGAVLMSTDDNVGLLKRTQRVLEASAFHPWEGEALWGLPGISGIRPGFLLLRMIPATLFMNVFHGLCLALAAWLLALYLRDCGLRPAACVFGGLVAFWVGTNLTLTYAGHIGKYGLMPFLALAIFALGRWGQTGRMAWSVVAGAATGAMFLEQGDVALFCALLLAPLGLREGVRVAGGWNVAALLKESWAAVAVAALLAGGASLAVRGAGVEEVTAGQSPEEHWAYITQWSQPPSESLDFIAPGWTGWRIGDEKGPYWGKLGRSEGWERTRQGFMNFKLESVYVGVLPLLFAVMALVEAVRRRREWKHSGTVLLWGGLCGVALLLAFGKYFPLYRPFSWLPGVSSIRNPNKFIHFFQLAWGVLAAFGLHAALHMQARQLRRWAWGAGAAGILFMLAALALWADVSSGAARLVALGWTSVFARAIQWNKAFSVTYAGAMFGVAAGLLALMARGVFHTVENMFPHHGKNAANVPQRGKSAGDNVPLRGKSEEHFPHCGKNISTVWKTSWLAWVPALVVLFDAAVILAPHYIQTMPPGLVAENELVRYLKREVGFSRTAMAGPSEHYNQWLTYLFPYHGVPTKEVTQLPRPPDDYTAFWQAVRDPLRQWRLAAVSHVLAPGNVAKQLMGNPAWASQLEVVWAYQPFADGRGGVGVRPLPPTADAPEVVLRLKPALQRVEAVRSWRMVEDAEALKLLGGPLFEPGASVLLPPGSPVCAPPTGDPGPPPEVEIVEAIPGRMEFTVKNHGPVVMRVAEKFDAGWRATVDGQSWPVLRVDYMFQGVALEEARTHRVVLRYAPTSWPLVMQAVGLLAGLGASLWLAIPRRRKEQAA